LALPSAFAYKTGISPLNKVLEMIGSMFQFQMSDTVLAGVIRFLFFIVIFTVLNMTARTTIWSGEDPLKKRTANIVSLAFAAIAVFFIKTTLIINIASVWAALLWLILILAFPAGLVVLGMWMTGLVTFGKDAVKKEPNKWSLALAALLAFLAYVIIAIFYDPTRGALIGSQLGWFGKIFEEVLSWAGLIAAVMFFVHLLRIPFHLDSAEGKSGFKNLLDSTTNALDHWGEFWRKRGDKPSMVSDVEFTQEGSGVKLKWSPIGDEKNNENIARYEIVQNVNDYDRKKIEKGAVNLTPVNYPGNEQVYKDIDPTGKMKFGVRGVDTKGRKGPWGLSDYKSASTPPVPKPDIAPALASLKSEIATIKKEVELASNIYVRTLKVLDATYTIIKLVHRSIPAIDAQATVAEAHLNNAAKARKNAEAAINAFMPVLSKAAVAQQEEAVELIAELAVANNLRFLVGKGKLAVLE
jgi:hypothetical protein